MNYKYILLFVFCILLHRSDAQKHTISGYITDKETGEKLIGANVYDAKLMLGTSTNLFGFYSIMGTAFVFIICMEACIKDIEIPIPSTAKYLVANCIYSPDSVWSVEVSNTVSVIDNSAQQPINGAVVQIFKNGTLLETLKNSGVGKYSSTNNNYPVAGEKYSMKVSAPGFNDIEAMDTIPQKMSSLIIHKLDGTLPSINTSRSAQIGLTVTFSDPIGEKNYYQLLVYGFFDKSTVPVMNNGRDQQDTNAIRLIRYTAIDVVFDKDNQNLFSDRLIDGKTYDLKVNLRGRDLLDLRKVYVKVIKGSRNYFLYFKSSNRNSGTKADDVFTEPVFAYNNIKNGMGVFA